MERDPLKAEECLAALKGLYIEGVISEPLYHKGIVQVVYELALEGEMDRAVGYLALVPASYLEKHQVAQMDADPLYARQVRDFARRLAQAGYAANEDDAIPFTLFAPGVPSA